MSAITNNPTLGMYVSAAVAIMVVLGLFAYLWVLDRRVQDVRRALTQRPTTTPTINEPVRPQRREQV